MKLILVNGKLTKEKLKQILKRHAPSKKKEKEYKHTLADVWPKEVEECHPKSSGKTESE